VTALRDGGTELDYIFMDSAVPVERVTWGAIKSMYRE